MLIVSSLIYGRLLCSTANASQPLQNHKRQGCLHPRLSLYVYAVNDFKKVRFHPLRKPYAFTAGFFVARRNRNRKKIATTMPIGYATMVL